MSSPITQPRSTDLFSVRPNDGTQTAHDLVHMDAQSIAFYGDIAQFIRSRLAGEEKPLSLLDIGPRTGAGLAMFRLLHHPLSYSGLKFDPVTGIDIDPMFKRTAEDLYPDIEALCGDALAMPDGRRWDVVMSSHTVEHVDDPGAFLDKMARLAKKLVVVACPYEEEKLIVWHKNRITHDMLVSRGFRDMHVYRSDHWFNSLCVIAAKRV
jgi:SAM-dependent methyltransferase